jgi:beta-glucanase (GH16 family)
VAAILSRGTLSAALLISAPVVGPAGAQVLRVAAQADCRASPRGAPLTFDDEFNTLDLSAKGRWKPDYPWATPDGKNEDGPDLSSYNINPNYKPQAAANPFSVKDGVLDIAIRRTPRSVDPSEVNHKPYVSGLLQTAGSFSQLYGYFEMRAKLPAGNGVGAAFWMIPEDGSWPPELDIMENLGQDRSTVYQTIHTGTTASDSKLLQVAVAVPGGDASSGFHTYGVDWEKDFVTFYVDGKATKQFATPASMHKPMYMILENDAAGAVPKWGKPVDASTRFPADFQVDYVRAYAALPDLSSGGSPPCGLR